jgi:hypothetical protein
MTEPSDRMTSGQRKLLEEAQKNIDEMQRMNNQVKILSDRTRAILARLLGNDQVKF